LFGAIIMPLVIAVVCARRQHDPVYQGKRLSEHLATLTGFSTSPGSGMSGPYLSEPIEPRAGFAYPDQTARYAVSAVGTNALPMLIGMLGSKDSQLGLWLEENTRNRPFLRRLIRTDRTRTWVRQMQATAAFHELGPRALPAVPAIVRLLDDPQCAMCAIISLMYIHPQKERDILSLTNVFRIKRGSLYGFKPDDLRYGAILALGSFGTNASCAVPFLLDCITSTNERIQAAVAVALVRIGAPPEAAVPRILSTIRLTNSPAPIFIAGRPSLGDPGMVVATMMKLWALEKYGRHASNALPMLSSLEQMSNSRNIKDSANAAIKAINDDSDSTSR
jgi:hypothetical protein